MISLTLDQAVQRSLRQFASGMKEPKWMNKSIVQGMNAAGDSALSALKKVVAKQMGVPQKAVKDKFKIYKATFAKGAKAKHQSIRIISRGRPVRLIYFATYKKRYTTGSKKNPKAGVVVKVWGQQKVYRDTFITTVKYPGKHTSQKGEERTTEGIFTRSGNKRLPIKQLYGPGVARETQRNEGVAADKYRERVVVTVPAKIKYNLMKELEKKGSI